MHSNNCHFNYAQVSLIIKATIKQPDQMSQAFKNISDLTVCKIKARKRILQIAKNINNATP